MADRKPWLRWLGGAAMTAALLAALFALSNFRYENSDDGLILKAFMGFEGGEPASFSLYVHTLLAWVLYALGKAAPGVPWFSAYQGALLVFSGTVIVKCFFQLACGHRRPWLAGGLMGLGYLAVFVAFAACRLNYTTTAALAGSAAVLQCLTAPLHGSQRGRAGRAYALSLLLWVAGYCLRAQGVLPATAFLALALAWQWARQMQRTRHPARSSGKPPLDDSPHPDPRTLSAAAVSAKSGARPEDQPFSQGASKAVDPAPDRETPPTPAGVRPVLLAALAFVLAFAALQSVRQTEIAMRGLTADVRWHAARTALMDYTDFEADPAPALQAPSGLSATQVRMVRQWFYLDAAITTDALQAMANAYAATPQPAPGVRLSAFAAQNPRQVYALLALCLLCGLGWLGCGQSARANALAATLALLGVGALLLALAWQGRVLARAVDAVLLPGAALLCGCALQAGVGRFAHGVAKRGSFGGADAHAAVTQRHASPQGCGALTGNAGAPLARLPMELRRPVGQSDAPGATPIPTAGQRIRAGLRPGGALARIAAICLAGMLAATVTQHLRLTLHAVTRAPDTVSMQREADLERYALLHPDMLILRSPNLLRDTRLAPAVDGGIPANIALWGDWSCRTPSWYAQLAALGFDGHAFVARDWLSPRLLLATADPGDMADLLPYLRAALGSSLTPVPAGSEGTLTMYRFVAGDVTRMPRTTPKIFNAAFRAGCQK